MMTETLAQRVRDIRNRILEEDPGAYSGFAVDVACRVVAREKDMRATDVVRAYRKEFPLRSQRPFIPPGARRPDSLVVERVLTDQR